jgi:hypothetical protein
MKLAGDYLFAAGIQDVWSALFDPVILAAVLPGCEKLERVDEHYVGDLKVKVGPVQGKFTGRVDLLDREEPTRYRMIVDGRGAPGFVKATAVVQLAAEAGGTRISYDADAQIGGKLASVGQRLIEASARAIVAQSLEGLHENIKLRAAAYAAAAAPLAAAEPEPAAAAAEPTASAGAAPADPAAADLPAAAEAPATPPAAAPPPPAAAEAPATPPAAAPPPPAAAEAPAAAPPAAAPRSPPAVAFTPKRADPAALAKSVAKEVAKELFPRSVLVAIIAIQALLILYLLIR